MHTYLSADHEPQTAAAISRLTDRLDTLDCLVGTVDTNGKLPILSHHLAQIEKEFERLNEKMTNWPTFLRQYDSLVKLIQPQQQQQHSSKLEQNRRNVLHLYQAMHGNNQHDFLTRMKNQYQEIKKLSDSILIAPQGSSLVIENQCQKELLDLELNHWKNVRTILRFHSQVQQLNQSYQQLIHQCSAKLSVLYQATEVVADLQTRSASDPYL